LKFEGVPSELLLIGQAYSALPANFLALGSMAAATLKGLVKVTIEIFESIGLVLR
jgi:hypothetical protein